MVELQPRSKWLAGETSAGRHVSITGSDVLIGFHSDTGKKPATGGGLRRINQDTAMIGQLGDDLLFAVYDGHGDCGRRVSRAVSRSVHAALSSAVDKMDKGPLLTQALLSSDAALPESDAKSSGTTAIVAILQQQPVARVLVACVGDSRCVLGAPGRSGFLGMGKEGPWEATDLSVDQKPDNPIERARLEAVGATITGGGDTGDPARVWRHVDGVGKMGVAVSRSIGDHSLRSLGVIAQAELVERVLEPTDACLVLGSDGLWDLVDSAKAVSLAQASYPDANEAARRLIQLATKRWRRAEANYRDDISVVVVYLNGPTGTTPNAGVAAALAVHGATGLGANIEEHEDEAMDMEEPGEDIGGLGFGGDDEETASESENDNEDDDNGDDDVPAGAPAVANAAQFNRRLTTLMESPPLGSLQSSISSTPALRDTDGDAAESAIELTSAYTVTKTGVGVSPAVNMAMAPKSSGGGCCLLM